MSQKEMRIGLASLKHPESIDHGIEKATKAVKEAASKKVEILCFPETYIPGLRGGSFCLPPPNQEAQKEALVATQALARDNHIAIIIGMEWVSDIGLFNLAYVISSRGRILGYQTKNQITPFGEDKHYVSDSKRKIFTINGVKVGIVICHEGWRYPETVRWATTRGAQIIFQPQVTGSDEDGEKIKNWGDSFYEKAMICRSQENSVYFASVNTAMRFQNSATSLISPSGDCLSYVPYGKEQILIQDIDLSEATRFYAKRYNPQLYSK